MVRFGTRRRSDPSVDRVSAGAGAVALARNNSRPSPGVSGWGRGAGLVPIEWEGRALGWWDRDAAMSLPTISRARDLICTTVGALPFTFWNVDTTQTPEIETRRPAPPWAGRPDRDRTRQWILTWTVDDLFFYSVAHWEIVDRLAAPNDWPSAFRRIAPGELHVDEQSGRVTVNGRDVPARNIVEFLSPIEGILTNGYRAISIALALDDAADRFAGTEVPAGVLEEQDGGEDLSADELAAMAATFTEARRSNTTAATNKYLRYRETVYDASKMQLVEGRTYQAVELARLGNIPPYLAGAPSGTGMTYINTAQATADLVSFGALPYIGCVEQTLSGPNVMPARSAVRLDVNALLRNPFTSNTGAAPNDLQIADPAAATPPAGPA